MVSRSVQSVSAWPTLPISPYNAAKRAVVQQLAHAKLSITRIGREQGPLARPLSMYKAKRKNVKEGNKVGRKRPLQPLDF